MTLVEFIEANHARLVSMTREKVGKRCGTDRPEELETKHGVHLFLDQLGGALVAEAKRDPAQQAQADPPTNPDIAKTAALHGHDLSGLGFSIEDVVHDYGDVCQAVTELAVELDSPISVADFHTLNRCRDNAIAAAVSAWNVDREAGHPAAAQQRDQKLRNLVSGAIVIVNQLRAGTIAAGGSAGELLAQHLVEMRAMLNAAAP